MKPFIILAWVFAMGLATSLNAADRQADWQRVQEAIQQGLPRTAITNLEPIAQASLKARDWAGATRALALRRSLESQIQGDKIEEAILGLEADLAKAPKEMQPVMETMLARWYWSYFQNNRGRFARRTAMAADAGKDLKTWDLPKLFREIDRHFTNALSGAAYLKQTPIGEWDSLLPPATAPDSLRPTLYDFLVHQALEFYSAGEQGLAQPEDFRELTTDEPYARNFALLGKAEQFYITKIERPSDPSNAERALFLWRDLLQFHSRQPDSQAFADADLGRLFWAFNAAKGETKETQYEAALQNFIQQWGKTEVGARARAMLAERWESSPTPGRAHQLASELPPELRDSPGGKRCANVIARLENPVLSIQTETLWPSLPIEPTTFELTYRNYRQLHFRAIPMEWDTFLRKDWPRPNQLRPEHWTRIRQLPVATNWSISLPPAPVYEQRSLSVPAPAGLRPGFYFILASPDPNFTQANSSPIVAATVWVSDIQLIVRSQNQGLEGVVVHATTGEPQPNAEVQAWWLDRNASRQSAPVIHTDSQGFFRFSNLPSRQLLVRARLGAQEISIEDGVWTGGKALAPDIQESTLLFTDRGLYRPGQTIRYKGLCVSLDTSKNDYHTLAQRSLTVVFQDPNGRELARTRHQCNDYGSFSGSFTTPNNSVLGQYFIAAAGPPPGASFFRVEEYKRPKFAVTLAPPTKAPKLAESVELTGKATAFTGAPIDSAKVDYTVTRTTQWPWWCWWRLGPTTSGEIAHGTTTTTADGSFKFSFIARPDLSLNPKDDPSFTFSVTANVTDSTGETRSLTQTVRAGYTALETTLESPDWLIDGKPIELKINTSSLDGTPEPASGSLTLYRLRQPSKPVRASLKSQSSDRLVYRPAAALDTNDMSRIENWPLDNSVSSQDFTTGTNGETKLSVTLPSGAYKAVLATQDRFGKAVRGERALKVIAPENSRSSIKIPHQLTAEKWEVEPGETFQALWETGYDSGRAFIELSHRGQVLTQYWTLPGTTQQRVQLPIQESWRGGLTLNLFYVRDSRSYIESERIEVPWSNKNLSLQWETFRSKLEPGQKESWALNVRRRTNSVSPGGNVKDGGIPTPAELVATLYDASLDAISHHNWPNSSGYFFREFRQSHWFPPLWSSYFNWAQGQPVSPRFQDANFEYRTWTPNLADQFGPVGMSMAGGGGRQFDSMRRNQRGPFAVADAMLMSMAMPKVAMTAAVAASPPTESSITRMSFSGAAPQAASKNTPNLSTIPARKNLTETAFFFPQLRSDTNGTFRFEFTMPEALTEWRFLGFAHDRELRTGSIEAKAVTSKQIMVQPNPPRFVREGDVLEFTTKVSNQTDSRQLGKVRLTFATAQENTPVDVLLGNLATEQPFDIPAKQSKGFAWRIRIPDGLGFLTFKAVAATDNASDGEEGMIPVLSRRTFVTESMALPLRGVGVKDFQFDKLLASAKSDSLKHSSLSVQVVSQPAWYAVMALPYLMEFPHECAEQTFNRWYANQLAEHIAKSNPKIERTFSQWRATPALDSPLLKNTDLKSLLIEETPWLREAQQESQARRNVGILFDANRLRSESSETQTKLLAMRNPNGAWPWFAGGPPSEYITLYITTGLGRLKNLGLNVPPALTAPSVQFLDQWMVNHYSETTNSKVIKGNPPSSMAVLYLYGRSFFLKDQPLPPATKTAAEFFLAQLRTNWTHLPSRQSQGHAALALKRFGDTSTPAQIVRSLRERAVENPEMGLFWRDEEYSWSWYRAPIETQALMIEVFDEVAGDVTAVENLKLWLLKQKQTQSWKSTKATADAVYSLLLRGTNWLGSDAIVEVSVGGLNLTPTRSTTPAPSNVPTPAFEPGTGFYERRLGASEIKPAMGRIRTTKRDGGIAWASIHWQYFEDVSKLTPHNGTPLKIHKRLFKRVATRKGPVLEPITGSVNPGDELVVRLELRTDRDMEFVHLKDQRGSGLEPVEALSAYRYQDGLGYYASPRDTANHYFIEYLPKGTYVFEYSLRAQLKGRYQSGIAEVQCMYAPEFNAHSESITIQCGK